MKSKGDYKFTLNYILKGKFKNFDDFLYKKIPKIYEVCSALQIKMKETLFFPQKIRFLRIS